MAAGDIELIPYQRDLAPLEGVKIYEESPINGRVKEVIIHWPDGCNALVDIAVWHGTTRFCPREGYLALNDATISYLFKKAIKMGDELWVEMRNTDAINSHAITVTIRVEEE